MLYSFPIKNTPIRIDKIIGSLIPDSGNQIVNLGLQKIIVVTVPTKNDR